MNKREYSPANDMVLRPVIETDWPTLADLLREVVAAQDALTYDANLTDAQIRELWGGSNIVVVAEAADGSIAGTAKMGRNQGGPGEPPRGGAAASVGNSAATPFPGPQTRDSAPCNLMPSSPRTTRQ